MGSDPDYVNIVLDNVYEEKDENIRNKVNSYYKTHPGSIGCYLSHLTLWQHLFRQATANKFKEKYVLIMEDDAYFTPYALQNIEVVVAQSSKLNWDLLYIGHNHLRGSMVHPLFLRPRKARPGEPVRGYNTGFFGYVVKTSSLQKIINIVRQFETSFVDLSVRDRFGEGANQISALFLGTSLIQHNKKYTSSRRIYDAAASR
jgi:GR25 family glycosyltransferase involved in LPS biosynthesis